MLGNPAKKVVFIIEHPEHLNAFLSLSEGIKAKLTIIATSPGVCWDLEKRSIGFHPVERYYDGPLLFQTGIKNFERVEEICNRIDSHLQNLDPVLKKFHFRPAMDNFFSTKLLYDALTLRIVILKGIIEKAEPDLIVTIGEGKSGSKIGTWAYLPFRQLESVYAKVLSLEGWPCASLFLEAPVVPSLVNGVSFRQIGKDLTGRIVSRFVQTMAPLLARGPSVLQIGDAYNWNRIGHLINKAGFHVERFYRGSGVKRSARQAITFLPGELVEKQGIFMGINLMPPILNHACKAITEYLETYPYIISHLHERFQRDPPVAVLFGTKTSTPDHIVAHIARYHHIPVISWQHGAQGAFYAPMMEYYEIMNSDLHLCFGDGVMELYEKDARQKFSCELRATGSYELETLFLDDTTHDIEFDVLYATTNYYLNNLYIGGLSDTTFQDNEFWRTQKRILDLLAGSGKKVAFKLHPGQYQERHLREYVVREGPANITVFKDERTFQDLALHAGAVVLDCPSTTLLEAIAGKKPVFTLTRHAKLTESAMSALVKRAYCTSDLDEFNEMLDKYLRRDPSSFHPDLANVEFLERYGIFKADGKVGERVLHILTSCRDRS